MNSESVAEREKEDGPLTDDEIREIALENFAEDAGSA